MALSFYVASDLHYGVSQRGDAAVRALAAHVCAHPRDALLLGGDLAHDGATLDACLALFERFEGARMAVPGNHDVWLTDERARDSMTLHDQVLPEAFSRRGFHPLHLSGARVGDVAFVGSMGWYDYSFREDIGVELEHYRRKIYPGTPPVIWNDVRFCRFDDDDPALTEKLASRLSRQLADAAGARAVVALVHHLVTRELLIGPRFLVPKHWRFANTFLGAERFGELLLDDERVSQVLSGHIHNAKTVTKRGRSLSTVGGDYRKKELLLCDERRVIERRSFEGA